MGQKTTTAVSVQLRVIIGATGEARPKISRGLERKDRGKSGPYRENQ